MDLQPKAQAGVNMLSPEVINVRALIAEYLRQRFPQLTTLDDATPLLETGAVDSLGILDLAAFLGERFGIEISDEDFEPQNFETFGRLIGFVESKRS
jgi:acyl carrier protein